MSVPLEKTGRRAVAVLTATLLLLQAVLFGSPLRAAAEPTLETSAYATPAVVAPGSSATITTTVTTPETMNVLIDVEIFDAAFKKVHQVYTDNIQVIAGEPKSVPFEWKVPAGLPEGRYIVSFGVFGAGWSAMYKWHAGAAELTVKKGEGTPDITGTAAVSPDRVKPGVTVKVDASVTSSVYTEGLVEISLVQPDGRKAASVPFRITLPAGQPKLLGLDWLVPADAPAGTYLVELAAYNADRSQIFGVLPAVAQFSVFSGEAPALPVPAGLKADPADTAVALSWSPADGAGGYELETDGVIRQTSATSYIHSGLIADTVHTYRVRAVSASVKSAWSDPVEVRTRKPAASGIKVVTKSGTNASAQMITPELEIYNTGTQAVKLSDLKARYYFTIDGEKPLAIGFWTTADKSAVQTEFVKMPVPSADADHYLEIRFTDPAAQLQPGAKAGVYTWINKNDWSSFDQTEDYSFVSGTSPADNPKATGYLAGKLSWGAEPVLLNLPPFPGHLAATPSDTSMALSWDAVEGASSYELYADGDLIQELTGTAYTVQWLRPGTLHTYKVRTIRDGITGVWSQPLSLKTTGQQILPAPENVRARADEGSVSLTWKALTETVTGYDIEADGAVLDAGTASAYTHTGLAAGTQHTYRVRAKDGATLGPWSAPIKVNIPRTPSGPFDVTFSINTGAERAPISPYIYGTNDDLSGSENWGSRRMGGNRLTTYNWENNASNAGEDYFEQSDDYIARFYGGIPWGGPTDEPGIGVAGFHRKSLQNGAYTLATVPIAGYVAKDKNGVVTEAEAAPSSRWHQVKPFKGSPLSTTPDLNDDYVYLDEFVHNMVNRFGSAVSPTGIKGYSLDNEPSLWSTTHPLIHPQKSGAAEVLTKGIAAAKAVKSVDPHAETYGPASFGFDEMYNMYGAPDWNDVKGNYSWYMDYYLDKFRVASLQENKRLLDALDIHWYPEITAGGYRITDDKSNDSPDANRARLQAPRSLWDPSYTEDSWIGTWYSSYLPLLPRLQQSIDTYNPGTKIAITEYNYGGENNVYGGIAQADVLGIFGKYGVHLATFWKMVNSLKEAPYISSAVKLFTNYDGQNSTFGDTKVKAETSDIENSSVYGSVFENKGDELHLVVLNKNNDYEMNAAFRLDGSKSYKTAKVYAFDSESHAITLRETITNIENGSFVYTLPKLTAAHIVLTAED